MSISKEYDDIVRELAAIALHNKSFLDRLHSSMRVQASFKGPIGPLDSYLKEAARVQSLYESLPAMKDILSSPALEFIRTANLDISKLTGISHIGAMIEQIGKISDAWRGHLAGFGFVSESTKEAQLALQSHFSQISTMSILAEKCIAGLDFAKLGMQLSLAEQIRDSFRSDLLAISESYRNLYTSFDLPEFNLLRFHPVVSGVPPIEYYNHTRITELFTLEEPAEDEERTNLETHLSKETKDVLQELLATFNADLIPMWRGANDALVSNNPDKVRHFTTSLRELYTQVLHQLAPNSRIKEWSQDPSHYDQKGKATRKARLLYICRNINHPPFSDFLSIDIQSVIAFIDLFQRGTHDIRTQFTDAQLHAMCLRAESSLRFMLEVGFRSSGT
jgi:hypothetical protein